MKSAWWNRPVATAARPQVVAALAGKIEFHSTQLASSAEPLAVRLSSPLDGAGPEYSKNHPLSPNAAWLPVHAVAVVQVVAVTSTRSPDAVLPAVRSERRVLSNAFAVFQVLPVVDL